MKSHTTAQDAYKRVKLQYGDREVKHATFLETIVLSRDQVSNLLHQEHL